MRTFSGTIVGCNSIRLENSLILKHNTEGFTLGSKVLISFDLCKNHVRHIWLVEGITSEPEPETEEETPNRSFDSESDDEHNRFIVILERIKGLSRTEF